MVAQNEDENVGGYKFESCLKSSPWIGEKMNFTQAEMRVQASTSFSTFRFTLLNRARSSLRK